MSFDLSEIENAYTQAQKTANEAIQDKCESAWNNISSQLSTDLLEKAQEGILYVDYKDTDSIYQDLVTLKNNPLFMADLPIALSSVHTISSEDDVNDIRVSLSSIPSSTSTTTTTTTNTTESE